MGTLFKAGSLTAFIGCAEMPTLAVVFDIVVTEGPRGHVKATFY